MKIKFVTIILVVLSTISRYSNGQIIFADSNSPYDPGSGTSAEPFRRVQDAIDAANAGDTVEIRPGIYTGLGNYDLDPNGKSITIRSTDPNDPDVVTGTIIDPDNAGRGFYFNSGEDANCVVSGLTIRNGKTKGSGGAICCSDSSPLISNCALIGNIGVWGGGGIFCYNSSPTVLNCVIAANVVDATGGGVKCYSGSKPKIVNCTISGNSAGWGGGGIYCDNSDAIITNCILWANSGQQIHVESSSPAVTYCDVQGGWAAGTGNIDRDPCFASFDSNDTPDSWDFHLQSTYGRWDPNSQGWVTDYTTSPCIDAGDPNSDYGAEPWPNGKRINMGCYGGMSQASMNGNVADFDVDGKVNSSDLGDLTSKWLLKGSFIEDLNYDGSINFADLTRFAENWSWQR